VAKTPKSLHQPPDSATAALPPCTGISKPDLKSPLNRPGKVNAFLQIFSSSRRPSPPLSMIPTIQLPSQRMSFPAATID
jgi:hypothetical protein